MKPKIGITGPDRGGWPAWMATRFAVWRAGGKGIRITPGRPQTLDGLHGLIIGGGADIDPKLYNETCVRLDVRKQIRREVKQRWGRRQAMEIIGYHPNSGFSLSLRRQIKAFFKLARYRIGLIVDVILLISLWLIRHLMSVPWQTAVLDHQNRDTLEIPLILDAVSRGLPVLGICRGMQLIDVCLGGSLYQEISVFYEETPILTTLLPRKRIEIAPTSNLSNILMRTRLHVNSLHYQSVKTLGNGLIAVAQESNGVIQAIEHSTARFIIGVQWHPEYLAVEKPSQQRLFNALVSAAKSTMQGSDRIAGDTRQPLAGELETLANVASSQRINLRQPIAMQ